MKMFIAVLLIASIGSIMGLKCYTCTYGAAGVDTNTEACKEPFDANGENVYSFDCSILGDTFDVCANTYGTIEGTYTAARTCFSSSLCPSADGCVSQGGATVCCCNTDNCNGAGSGSGSGSGSGDGTGDGTTTGTGDRTTSGSGSGTGDGTGAGTTTGTGDGTTTGTGNGNETGTGAVTVAFNIVATVAVVIAAMAFTV